MKMLIAFLSLLVFSANSYAESNVNSAQACQKALKEFRESCNPLYVGKTEGGVREASTKCKGGFNKKVTITESTQAGGKSCQVIEERADGTQRITRYQDGGIRSVLEIKPDGTQNRFYHGANGVLTNRNGTWGFITSQGDTYNLRHQPSRDDLNRFLRGNDFIGHNPSVYRNGTTANGVNN